MTDTKPTFTGRWLSDGERRGTDFTHDVAEFDHKAPSSGGSPMRMRHAHIDQAGTPVAVWVPADWSDDQAREALENNW